MLIFMKNLIILLIFILIFVSCKEKCSCELILYECTYETNYEWIENNREHTETCDQDTLSSTFLDQNGNISYVRTIIECN